MYLSKLTILGFKSFARKCELTFSKGIASIVGPNGCGKTNILDAIRWVIGEQKVKTLRSESMQDIIFNGSKNRQPLGMAEVLLQLKDCKGLLPYDPAVESVAIGRRLYRSGESEYLINGREVRLKDIQSILMGTGIGSSVYSLIELSMIQRIISGGKEDRRELLEEAAGIMKYKVDRKTSESKLQSTENDLARLDDIIREVETNVSALKRQLRRAKELEKLKSEAKNIALELLSTKYRNIVRVKNSIAKELALKEEELAVAQSKRSEFEARRQTLSVERDHRESEVGKAADALRKTEQEIAQKEKEYAVLEERITHTKNSIESAKAEIEESAEFTEKYSTELASLHKELKKAEKIANEIKDEIEQRTKVQSDADKRYLDIRKEAARIRVDFNEIKTKISSSNATIDANKRQIGILAGQSAETLDLINRADIEISAKKTELEKLSVQVESLKKSVQNSGTVLTGIRSELEKTDKKFDALISEINTCLEGKAKLEGRLRGLEGLSQTPADLMTIIKAHKSSIPGKISELVIPEKLPAPAIDRILGEMSDALVVKTVSAAEKISQEIMKSGANAILLVLEELPEPKTIMVKTKPGAEKLNSLFEGYSIGSIDASGEKVVSARGDYLRMPGIRKIGKPEIKKISIGIETEELKNELSAIAKKYSALVERREKIEEDRTSLDEKLSRATGEHESNLKALASCENEMNQAKYAFEFAGRQIESAKKRAAEIEDEKNKLIEIIEKKKEELHFSKNIEEDLENALKEKESAEANAETLAKETAKKLTEIHMSFVQSNAERERLQVEIHRLEMQRGDAKTREENARQRITELEQELFTSEKSRSGFSDNIEKLFLKKESVEKTLEAATEHAREMGESVRKMDLELRDINNSVSALEKIVHEKSIAKHDEEMQASWIKENAQTDYGVNIEDIEPEHELDEEETRKSQLKLDRLKQRITEFGGVNMEAETEYDEQKKRFDFLTSQRDDLREASSELKKTIKKLDNAAREQFIKTFDETRRNFKEIFVGLFEGGEADIKLEEGVDILEADIEIIARPRGKKMLSINQLSTGEKALCALSLLFGLYKVKPSPFCMLDEVESPLDDANIDRFIDLLKRFSDETQFILITHNKKTMEAAGYIYGVTMQEDGVSKALSLRMSDLSLDFEEYQNK